jgi:putative membrane protein insertion efficiency factor
VTFPARVMVRLLRGYQFFSRRLPNHCRYEPTCSVYAAEAITLWGALRGSWLAVRRLGRCHPWGGCGYDPVPSPPPDRRTRRRSLPERDVPSLSRTPVLTK